MITEHSGPFTFERSAILSALRLEHGFGDASFDTGFSSREEMKEQFCKAFQVAALQLLKQVHGTRIIEASTDRDRGDIEADGWLISRAQDPNVRVAYGVISADCLPIIIAGPEEVALIHAGWRGICAQIHIKAVEHLCKRTKASVLKAALGPCASEANYEVGEELLEEFGGRGEFHRHGGKLYLDLRASVVRALLGIGLDARMIEVSQQCTIGNLQYHSYRRSRSKGGRNISFVIV